MIARIWFPYFVRITPNELAKFMILHYPERQQQIERFAKEALPALKA